MKKNRLQWNADTGMCLWFVGFLLVFFLISIIKPDTGFSEFENRYLEKKPELHLEAVLDGTYMEDMESYVTDQFPFRNQWITVKTLAERLMLKSEINGVYFARDDYYIEKQSKEELYSERALSNQEALTVFAEKYKELLGAEHVSIMMVPTASYILKDKLPYLAPDDGQETILAELEQKLPEGVWVDVAAMLQTHKEEEIYYRTDHHWTTLGAFYGYCAWKEKQGEALPQREDYQEECLSDSFTGTLYAKVNVEMKPDKIYAFIKSQQQVQMRLDMSGEWWDSLYSCEKLDTRDQYAVFCDGNHAMTEIVTELNNDRHLLVIKDSYAHCLVPFFVSDFEKITMIDLRYYNGGIEEYIKGNNVTDVLTVYNLSGFSSDRYVNKLKN